MPAADHMSLSARVIATEAIVAVLLRGYARVDPPPTIAFKEQFKAEAAAQIKDMCDLLRTGASVAERISATNVEEAATRLVGTMIESAFDPGAK